ncbi:MAG: metal-sensitive transcriptional regulator [Candidatus Moranbacteria bacterium]|nr:metal-sensitive transcriptional regulator [bacterium]MDZ4385219.1 metal-sensitive transcriptional regulator [Candidatus Moranbacteria bacterium]
MEDKEILTALRKAQSHLGNVIKMVENKEYCIDILQQNLAVIGLLKSGNNKLMERHLNSCFANAMKGTNEERKREMIEEILKINNLSK